MLTAFFLPVTIINIPFAFFLFYDSLCSIIFHSHCIVVSYCLKFDFSLSFCPIFLLPLFFFFSFPAETLLLLLLETLFSYFFSRACMLRVLSWSYSFIYCYCFYALQFSGIYCYSLFFVFIPIWQWHFPIIHFCMALLISSKFCWLRAAAYFSCCGKRYLLFFIGIEALSLIVHSSLFFSFDQTLISYFFSPFFVYYPKKFVFSCLNTSKTFACFISHLHTLNFVLMKYKRKNAMPESSIRNEIEFHSGHLWGAIILWDLHSAKPA